MRAAKEQATVRSGWTARRLSLLALAGVTAAGLAWYFFPAVGPWPLMVGLPLAVAALVTQRRARLPLVFHAGVLLIIASAALGASISYDPQQAHVKFWVLVGAALLYFAIAGQPESNLSAPILVMGFWMSALIVYFALNNSFAAQPSGFGFIDRIGRVWMQVRPWPAGWQIPNDAVGGAIAILLPVLVAATWHWRRDRALRPVFVGLLVMAAFGTAITGSHAAWLAMVVGAVVLGLGIGLRYVLPERPEILPFVKLGVSIAAMVALAATVLVILKPGPVLLLLARVPGWGSTLERLGLFQSAAYLPGDFLFTGGGLASFPGLYSWYILGTHNFFLGYAHNLFLDLWIEQGLIGVAIVVLLLAGAIWVVLSALLRTDRQRDLDLLRIGLLTSLVVMVFHGLIEDALYGLRGMPLFLALIGYAIAIRMAGEARAVQPNPAVRPERSNRLGRKAGIPALVICLVVLIVFRRPVQAEWYANLGSIAMARVDLAGFPDPGRPAPAPKAYTSARALLLRALQYDPSNRAANYRLGLMAYEQQDYAQAIPYLEKAYRDEPGDHGVEKFLGYSYAWTGQVDRAATLLSGISEARKELHYYTWWWGTQNHSDRAGYAMEVFQRLAAAKTQ